MNVQLLPEISLVVRTLILHVAISISVHGLASADGRYGRCDHDPPSHVLILFSSERSGSQFVCGVACQSVR